MGTAAWPQLLKLIVSAGLAVRLRTSGKLIVPALLSSSSEYDTPDDAPRCRLHFSIQSRRGVTGVEPLVERDLQIEPLVERDLQETGFLPRGAYDHLCAALLMWSQRIKGRYEPELSKSSMKIRLCRHTLVRALHAEATQRTFS